MFVLGLPTAKSVMLQMLLFASGLCHTNGRDSRTIHLIDANIPQKTHVPIEPRRAMMITLPTTSTIRLRPLAQKEPRIPKHISV